MAGARLPFDCWRLTGLHASRWNRWRLFYFESLFLQRSRWCGALLQCWCVMFLRCTVDYIMDTSSYSSPMRTHMDKKYHSMCVSHDSDRSDPKDLCSFGVIDLDLSLSPDAFGLRAFDPSKPLTRMLPGSSACELRLMLPDLDIGPEGFHDVLVENLAASPTWWSRHISPGMLLRYADDGRRLYLGPCDGVQRKWSGSVGLLVIAQRGPFGIVIRYFARSVRNRPPLPWAYT